jgi:hypothetical protein
MCHTNRKKLTLPAQHRQQVRISVEDISLDFQVSVPRSPLAGAEPGF